MKKNDEQQTNSGATFCLRLPGEKPIFGPLSKNNTRMVALRAAAAAAARQDHESEAA